MAVELMGYSGSKLSDDAQAFAVAEENYNPDGPVDASYAPATGQGHPGPGTRLPGRHEAGPPVARRRLARF